MKTETINGYYGFKEPIPSKILVVHLETGGAWYCAEGSHQANLTFDPIEEGVNIEELTDVDTFTDSNKVIEDFEHFIYLIEL